MKKFLSVMFAVMFIFSAMSVAADAWSTSCPYCGATFSSEDAYAEHMNKFNHTDGHYITCPYTGDDYEGGGCGEKFSTKAAYDVHVITCKHKGDYTGLGYLKNVVLKQIIDAVKGVDWGSLFGGIVSVVKALVKGIDFGELWNTIKGSFKYISA
ncbi:MAG: hypothetical protein IJ050_08085 [Clostridia bacterium]|nr:hypothetical protein [Clostridia bacterium]